MSYYGATSSITSKATTTTLSSTATGSRSSTSSATTGTVTHTVEVGPKTSPHGYSPHNITANVGDVIVFEFYPRNHSVVKADYLAPCVPASKSVFYSGMFNSFNEDNGEIVGPPPTWSLVVNDTEPTFFYCTAIDSCLVNGMVGVINPNETMTWEAQYEKAKTYPYMLVPGQSIPAEGSIPTSTSTSSAAPSASSSSSKSGGLSGGAIAGIVVGSVAFVGILGALFFLMGRNRVYQKWISSQDGRTERTARWAAMLIPGHGGEDQTQSQGHGRGKGEYDAGAAGLGVGMQPLPQPYDYGTAQSPGTAVYATSPEQSGSPQPQSQGGHWSWGAQQQQQVYQEPGQVAQPGQVYYEAMARGPTELDATSRK
ncbi:uncharacterized protein BP01DRAFT_335379 [Aspergillus saccharolyticus JOP 1030-1]|uniref:Extracellular serine-rich protein n=1 Tax=Aspergillus saccharolyticus JOP 1030-1 TaxID=1450539 RepID=A0A319A7F3_9EURO|nr:hypothetical protein BP01DRAFT_335379 [Aspergillus saccharolyticus JOP 1030-1]PYH47808.1 hypothetical protein BP01DRAFT_335379 [Aspergillus saccharolyticus JOP 1030-1]